MTKNTSIPITAPASVSIAEFERNVKNTDQADSDDLNFPLLGLFGEVGTLLSALKKKKRDHDSYVGYVDAIMEEFGDSLWYLTAVGRRGDLTTHDLANKLFKKRIKNANLNHTVTTFDELQTLSRTSRRASQTTESAAFERALIVLAGKVGVLLDHCQQGIIENNQDSFAGDLVDVFKALIEAANAAGINLSEAAAKNIAKTQARWPTAEIYPTLFDENFSQLEQLPRKIEMKIIEKKMGNRTFVIQQCKGLNIGSQITDNRMVDDDYRFHDVFHLSYAAYLGWSPVLRGLFKLKRKSEPKIDEAQDGARAILIEEGISTLIFHRALQLKYFEGINSLDYSLLKLIPEFVRGYEVDKCPLWLWEKAILSGFEVFRQLQKTRQGTVIADLKKRRLTFRAIT